MGRLAFVRYVELGEKNLMVKFLRPINLTSAVILMRHTRDLFY